MTPTEFVVAIAEWSAVDTERIPLDHVMTTVEEARAICDVLRRASVNRDCLHAILGFFQSVEIRDVATVLRDEGLPLLRGILTDALSRPQSAETDELSVFEKTHICLFLLKILALYQQQGDGALIAAAARVSALANEYLWCVVLDIVGERHPDAMEICDALREPLPEGFVGVAYLDFANGLAANNRISNHPFNSDLGMERIAAYLTDDNPDNSSYAISAAACLPFIESGAREKLMNIADRHPDGAVRLEAAWASAKRGSEFGRHRLAQQCLNPKFAIRAISYLEELGLGRYVPQRARGPDFQAKAEMCNWLMHPAEYGRPPNEITQYDTRVLNWPPTNDRRRLWLFKYRYHARGDDGPADDGIGLVGSVTFSLVGDVTADMTPEDVYALHCCWELKCQQDARAPDEATIAAGRKVLAAVNPDLAG
jgi:hypothetical protein